VQTSSDRVPRPAVLRQRGAVGVFMIISMLLLVPIMALALNIGRLYYAQRDLEKQATLAALSGVQVVSGCVNQGVPGLLDDVTTEVNRVIGLNAVGNQDGPEAVLLTGINGAAAVEIGRIEVESGLRRFEALPDGDPRVTAVRVNLTRAQPTPLLFPFGGGGMLFASATAQQAPMGTFTVGSGLLSLNGGVLNGLLGGLLCAPGDVACQNSIVSLSVLDSMQGLLNTSVSLGQLATALGVSVADLSNPVTLAATTPVLPNVLGGLVSALGSTADGAVIATLQGLANAASSPNTVPLGQLLGVIDGLGGDTPVINLFDLLIALGQASVADPSGVKTIGLPINLNVPGVAAVSTFIAVLESPRLGAGRAGEARAETAQIRILIRIAAGSVLNGLLSGINAIVNGVLGLLGLVGVNISTSIAPPPLNLGVDVTVAGAAATLDRLRCPTIGRADPIAELSVQTATATVAVGTFSGAATAAPPLNTGTTSFPVATVNASAPLLGSARITVGLGLTGVGVGNTQLIPLDPVTDFTPLANQTPRQPTVFRADGVPPDAPVANNPQTVGSPTTVQLNLALSTTQTVNAGLLGSLVNLISGILNGVVSALQPLLALVNGLTTALVDPLLALLGIQLGTGTVTMQAAQIGQPVLVTTCLPGTAACP
jgi:uncharacterized membrane protein